MTGGGPLVGLEFEVSLRDNRAFQDSSINYWKQRKKRSVENTAHGCGLNDKLLQEMEMVQNNVIYEDEWKEQSYRDDTNRDRLLLFFAAFGIEFKLDFFGSNWKKGRAYGRSGCKRWFLLETFKDNSWNSFRKASGTFSSRGGSDPLIT